MLESTLRNAGVTERAESIFVEWPEIEQIALQFIRFVSPWLIVNDRNVAEVTLQDAFAPKSNKEREQKEFPHRSFMEAITRCVTLLASVRISVMNGEGLWEIWSYDEPLWSWMEKRGRSAMQIRSREAAVEHGPLLIKMLAYMCSTRDMQLAEIAFSTPFDGGRK